MKKVRKFIARQKMVRQIGKRQKRSPKVAIFQEVAMIPIRAAPFRSSNPEPERDKYAETYSHQRSCRQDKACLQRVCGRGIGKQVHPAAIV